ncbi:MAG TPA: metallophosphoesterase [Tepidisphaeraceae bacterium]
MSAAALALPRMTFAADAPTDPHRFILVSDIHIDANRDMAKSNTNPWNNFRQASDEIVATCAGARPAAVLINGDLTHHQGNPEDYATVIDAFEPLRRGGLTLHLAMGNHDDRGNFFRAMPADARRRNVPERQVFLLESPRANFLVLDSLREVAETPGFLGPAQLAWLAKTLDAHADKPALVFVHHDPDQRTDEEKKDPKKKVSGLIDTKSFLDVIVPRKQVKAFIFGHTHEWRHEDHDGLHYVNLPTTAWLFKEGPPRGWVDLELAEKGGTFTLHSLDPKHPQHGQKLELSWR